MAVLPDGDIIMPTTTTSLCYIIFSLSNLLQEAIWHQQPRAAWWPTRSYYLLSCGALKEQKCKAGCTAVVKGTHRFSCCTVYKLQWAAKRKLYLWRASAFWFFHWWMWADFLSSRGKKLANCGVLAGISLIIITAAVHLFCEFKLKVTHIKITFLRFTAVDGAADPHDAHLFTARGARFLDGNRRRRLRSSLIQRHLMEPRHLSKSLKHKLQLAETSWPRCCWAFYWCSITPLAPNLIIDAF